LQAYLLDYFEMSMRPEQEDFKELRRLVAMKRYEQPYPGYFQRFSRQVVARIQAGETAAADSLLQRLVNLLPWRQPTWGGLEAKALVAGAFALGVCSLLVIGLVSSECVDANAASFSEERPILLALPARRIGFAPYLTRRVAAHSVTDALLTAQSGSSIFAQIQRPRTFHNGDF
jgi:hypothetical protein